MSKNWKIRKIDLTTENNLITGLIVSTKFIVDIKDILDINLLQSSSAKIIAKWCLQFYKTYKEAPGITIKDIFESKKDDLDETTEETISMFLINLSERYEDSKFFNEKYVLSQSEKYLSAMSLKKLKADIETGLSEGKVEHVERLVTNYKRRALPETKGVDVIRDIEVIKKAYNERTEPLYKLPGVLGDHIGVLGRDEFFMFLGPAGRGKSFWLQEIGVDASMKGLNVILFSLEMSLGQSVERLYQRFLGETNANIIQNIKRPILDCQHNVENTCKKKKRQRLLENCKKDIIRCTLCKGCRDFAAHIDQITIKKGGLEWSHMEKKARALERQMANGHLMMLNYPSNYLDVNMMERDLDYLEEERGIIADVVLIDYPDIMKPTNPREPHIHRINNIWEGVRSLGQQRHILVGAVSHTNKSTFTKDIGQGDASEDSRKMNHVTHAIALNQSDEEQENGLMRLSLKKKRFSKFNSSIEIMVLQCLDLGHCYLDSYFKGFRNSRKNNSKK